MSRVIRIFLSSTFRDMQEEREQIVHHVLPGLQKRCQERQVELIFVDLRWGITQAESETDQVIQLCLDQVQRAHETPIFFIALLGERYGWIPTLLPQTLLQAYPWLEDAIGKSATEMEILYAERLQQQAPKQAFVYHRAPELSHTIQTNLGMAAEAESSTQAQHALTQRLLHDDDFIARTNAYASIATLAEWLGEDLWQAIDKLFPAEQVPDALALERQAHQDFAASRRKVYISDPQVLTQLDELLPQRRIVLIAGDSGLGKSALLANWTAHYQAQNPQTFVIEHYIGGGSNQSAEIIPMLQRILAELKQHFAWPDELPAHDKIITEFATWLYKINQPTLLVIDAINQLVDTKQHTLFWLPATLPQHLTIIVSATPETASIISQNHQVNTINVTPLNPQAQQSLIASFLDRHGKKLDAKQQHTIIQAPASNNPLYLTILLEELRSFGNYEQLNQQIAHYLTAADPKNLLVLVLARLETDYGHDLLQDILSFIATAREGLSETELLQLLNIPRKHFDPAFFTLMAHLVNKQGQYQFFHTYLAQAVQERYLTPTTITDYRQRQVTYWQPQTATIRKQRELPWSLQELGNKEALSEVLLDIELIFAVANMDKYELLGYWLFSEVTDYAQLYVERGLDWAQSQHDVEAGRILNEMGSFLYNSGHYQQTEPLYQRSLAISKQAFGANHPHVAMVLNNLAELYRTQGQYAQSEPLYQRSLAIFEQALGANHPNVATSLNNLAGLYHAQGQYAQAESLFQRSLAILEQVLGAEHPHVAQGLSNLALLYHDQGQYTQAEPLFKRSLAIREQTLDPDHPDVAQSLNNLALLYRYQGQYEQAEPLYQRSLAICEQVLGSEHPDVATGLNNLAQLSQDQGQYTQAEHLFKRSLAIREQILGTDHPDVATSLHNLAELYQIQGEYAQAEPLYKRSLAVREQVLDANHPDVAASLNGLASLYQAQGQYTQAEPLYKRSLAIEEQVFGADHPDVATGLNNLALLYQNQGQYTQAEPLYKRSLAILEQVLGAEHPHVAQGFSNLALLYHAQGQYTQAEPLFKRSLAIREQTLDPDHPDVATSLNRLTSLYQAQGQYTKAEPLYKRSLAIQEQVLGTDHTSVAANINNLAVLYKTQGQYEQAEPLYQRSLAIYEQVLGSEHPDVATSLNNLALLYKAQGKYTQVGPLYKRSLAIQEQVLGADHPDVAASLNNLAMLYKDQGQYTEAEPLFRRSLAIREQTLGADHPDVAQSLNNLALLYHTQGEYAQAEPLLKRSLAIQKQVLGVDHPDVATSVNNLAALYGDQGQYTQAEPLFKRSLAIQEQALGKTHPDTQTSFKNLYYILKKLNKDKEARALKQQFNLVSTFRRKVNKVKPNEACPCGSGKKYKKCCGKL